MYLKFYGLREAPFNITPDPRFLFFSSKHQEAYNHLLYGIHERKGFIELTGEVGTGKTTICRKLLEDLGPNYRTALILNPCLSATQLLRAVATELGVPMRRQERLTILQALNEFVLEQVNHQNDVVVVVDEAQDLSDELLEHLRLLSNLETHNQKLMQIVLVGQPELRDKLARPELRPLRQRIAVRYHLSPLNLTETAYYIDRRLSLVVTNNGMPRFDKDAVRLVHKYSGGIPRLINVVCDKTLLAGFVAQTQLMTENLVKTAIDELHGRTA